MSRPTVTGRLLPALLSALILALMLLVWNATVGMERPFSNLMSGLVVIIVLTAYYIGRDRRTPR